MLLGETLLRVRITIASAAVALALALAGCGGDDEGGGGPSGGGGGGDGGAPRVVTDGSELDCPFTAQQVSDIVGEEVEETTPVDATFGGSATCQFAGAGGGATSVSFGPVGAADLGPKKEGYTSDPGTGGEVQDRPEWGEGAFSWSNEIAGSETAVGFFPTTDSGLVGVNVVVPDGANEALESLVEVVGPAGG